MDLLTEDKKIKSVLIVDDSEADVFLTRKFLERSGKFGKIHNASNGEEALELLRKLRAEGNGACPSIILLDINMPRMNGFEFLEEYEKLVDGKDGSVSDGDDPVSHILMFTTSDYADDIDRAQQYACVNKYLIKPLTPSNIDEILDEFGS